MVLANVKRLIEQILSDKKLQNSRNFQSKIYREEPILRTASQLSGYMPSEYLQMRKISKSYDAYYQSEEWLFYQQGKFMEAFEDDFEFHGDYVRYFPTYQTMNDNQLRGYFSWRTKVRKGMVEQACLSFVFVYIYELLNQIGVKSVLEGYQTLYSFWKTYREMEPHIDRYFKLWLRDYIIYYGLDRTLLEEFVDLDCDNALLVLLDCSQRSQEELFSALSLLSSYRIENSKFQKEYSDDVKAVVCGVFFRLREYYENNRKTAFLEKLFGKCERRPYLMFRSAVFYDRMKYDEYEYSIDDIYCFRCKQGKWDCQSYLNLSGKSQELGKIMRAIDCLMRQRYDFKPLLKEEDIPKYLVTMIYREIDRCLEDKKKNHVPKIEIDLSALQGIRQAAALTRDRLIVDEEEEQEVFAAVLVEEPVKESALSENQTDLDDIEYQLLHCLLYGGDYCTLLKKKGIMLSVAVDSINEKLFDLLADTAIIFEGESPQLIEDYLDELKGIIPK